MSTEEQYAADLESLSALLLVYKSHGRPLTPEEHSSLARRVQALTPQGGASLALVDTADIFAPLPPINWLVQALDMCPGAPTLTAGYGFSMKTLSAQAKAVAVAAGRRVWGDFSCRQGRAVHIDYEQGSRLTFERYQRLARGMGVTLDDLRGRLAVCALPSVHLSSVGALDAYCRAFDGAAYGIVDSLRASGPDVEENSSEVRRLLDTLTMVSERTGCTTEVIHHARKPSQDASGGAKMAIRGSGAIFDACASVLVFGGAKGEPVMVQHEKARTSGILHDDFALTVEDVEIDGDPRAGLRVRTMSVVPASERVSTHQREKRGETEQAVLGLVVRNPGANLRFVRGNVDGKNAEKDDALERLKAARLIEERDGPRGARTFWPLSA